jgi:uncharacterized protein (TIGR00251 family)
MFAIKETEEGITFTIRVLPRSSRSEIVGLREDALKIKITAPPVEGLANEECIKFLARELRIPKSRISILSGHGGKKKVISIAGLNRRDIEALLPS